jgi:uncharacterized protein
VGKLIIIILGIAVLWLVLARSREARSGRMPPSPRPAEDMVRCRHCGVHFPRGESYQSRGDYFCSEEHLRLHH